MENCESISSHKLWTNSRTDCIVRLLLTINSEGKLYIQNDWSSFGSVRLSSSGNTAVDVVFLRPRHHEPRVQSLLSRFKQTTFQLINVVIFEIEE